MSECVHEFIYCADKYDVCNSCKATFRCPTGPYGDFYGDDD